MSLNTTSPSTFTSSVLIGDAVKPQNSGSADAPPTMTVANGAPVSACLELQSTSGGLLLPRMTTAQINAISNPVAGMKAFNSSLNAEVLFQNGAFGAGSTSTTYTSITSAQFGGVADIYDTPITLVPAAGANTLIIVDRLYLQLVYHGAGAVAYAGGGAVSLQYGTAPHAAGPTLATATIAAADIILASNPAGNHASTLFTAGGVQLGGTPGTLTATLVNQAISISNDTAAFTAGNSNLIAYVIYRVIATA